jgi:hypothetical protein
MAGTSAQVKEAIAVEQPLPSDLSNRGERTRKMMLMLDISDPFATAKIDLG